mmetsp:Transcript_14747/g.33259  ORF Transcript_14747/g.33259 Transcript_14747/m.33259 type:complete len:289 (-) Transcript_14747:394-1260(-)
MEAFHPLEQTKIVRFAIDPSRAGDIGRVRNIEVAVEPTIGGQEIVALLPAHAGVAPGGPLEAHGVEAGEVLLHVVFIALAVQRSLLVNPLAERAHGLARPLPVGIVVIHELLEPVVPRDLGTRDGPLEPDGVELVVPLASDGSSQGLLVGPELLELDAGPGECGLALAYPPDKVGELLVRVALLHVAVPVDFLELLEPLEDGVEVDGRELPPPLPPGLPPVGDALLPPRPAGESALLPRRDEGVQAVAEGGLEEGQGGVPALPVPRRVGAGPGRQVGYDEERLLELAE